MVADIFQVVEGLEKLVDLLAIFFAHLVGLKYIEEG